MIGRRPHLVLAGGGTGGHLFPGIAVAQALRDRWPQIRLTFVGCGKPFEQEQVDRAGFDYFCVSSAPSPQKLRDLPAFCWKNLSGYRAARRFLKKEHVDLVIGLGGYVAFPTARAAVSLRRKLVLLEQNAIPGRVTRLLSRHADLVGTAFEETRHFLASRTPVLRTGTPVRQALFEARPDELPRAERILLILGGSGGARALNETVPKALYRIRDRLAGWKLVHQTGPSDRPSTESLYAKLGLSARVESFLEMGPILRQTDLIVCRAGGSTLAELASFGVPAVLLPYPFAADNHQRRNAEYFARSAGAVLVDQRDSGDRLEFDLAREIENLVADPLRRERLSYLMKNQGRPEAARHVAQRVVELLERPDLVPRHDRTEPPWRRAS